MSAIFLFMTPCVSVVTNSLRVIIRGAIPSAA